MTPRCARPIPPETLADYWFGELGGAQQDEVERHLLGCAHCIAQLEQLAALGAGVRSLVRHGRVAAVATPRYIARLAEQGVKLREYRVARNGSVQCSVAPDDEVVYARLEGPFPTAERLDVSICDASGVELARIEDIPHAADAREILFCSNADELRASPAFTYRYRILAKSGGEERLVGEYTFNHSPWAGTSA